MRMGWDHDSLNAPELAHIAEDLGAKLVTVHGRTRNQLYRDIADWGFVRRVKAAVSVPVIVNGDLCSADDGRPVLEQRGAHGLMNRTGWKSGVTGRGGIERVASGVRGTIPKKTKT